MIYAGLVYDISWQNGKWLILDIGFSNSQKSCGILLGDEEAKQLTFNETVHEVIRIANSLPLLNLVIEAPLSVTFDKSGNPKGRSMEKEGGKNRLWYVGPGCAVLVAGMYLMGKLYGSRPSGDIKLFEGFVSYKSKEAKSSHSEDVDLLREAIKAAQTKSHNIIMPEEIKTDPDDSIESAFEIMKLVDIGIPPIIKVDK
ncbi:MAG: hypothetical protein AMXMBFR85_07960 [Dehalococcoides mccartyi]|nr:hypothetical protein [Dehalococcoides mccartyi]